MTDGDKVIKLASVNDDVRTSGRAAAETVVSFLRDWADAIENGDETVEKAVLVVYNALPDGCFRVGSRRCNSSVLETVAIMHPALTDMSDGSEDG